jgi:hypothetical protein
MMSPTSPRCTPSGLIITSAMEVRAKEKGETLSDVHELTTPYSRPWAALIPLPGSSQEREASLRLAMKSVNCKAAAAHS